jgi:hypothetical protein
MRSLIVAVTLVSALAFASGAFAQTTEQPAQPSTQATTPEGQLGQVSREHPGWFMEPNTYKPCPSSVLFPNGSPACLGCPVPCRWHFPRYSRDR